MSDYSIRKDETWATAQQSIAEAAANAATALIAKMNDTEQVSDFKSWFINLEEYEQFENACERLWGCQPIDAEGETS